MAHEPLSALLSSRTSTGGDRRAAPRLPLTREAFLETVCHTPLISIDLLLVNPMQQVLLGLRRGAPAKHYWFVPGGRIYKNEPVEAAFRRISLAETGQELRLEGAQFRGVFEHFYEDNFAGVPGTGTHYLTLAYRVQVDPDGLQLPREQHEDYRWTCVANLLASCDVHRYTKAYFKESCALITASGQYGRRRG